MNYRMTEEEFDEMMLAVHEGRASELMRCPVDDSLQGIASIYNQPLNDRRFPDPYSVVTLRCGHKVL